MYGNNPYARNYNPQNMYEQIDAQINNLQQMKERYKNSMMQQQQPSINQTFQIAPSPQGGLRYANSIEEVNKEVVFSDTPFFSKDMSVLWLKSPKNDIKAYELKEIVKKDEKDLQIELLMARISELEKGRERDEQPITNDIEKPTKPNTNASNDTTGATTEEDESTSIQRVPGSKKK